MKSNLLACSENEMEIVYLKVFSLVLSLSSQTLFPKADISSDMTLSVPFSAVILKY